MPIYTVAYEVTYAEYYTVKADTEEEALEKAENGEWLGDSFDCLDRRFMEIEEEKNND